MEILHWIKLNKQTVKRVLHCVRRLPSSTPFSPPQKWKWVTAMASSPLGSHVTIRNIQLLPKSLSHNIRQCVPPPTPGSRSHGTLIGNQYGATQPRPKMPFWQNELSLNSPTILRSLSLSLKSVCVSSHRVLILCSTIPTETVHIPNWEGKKPVCCVNVHDKPLVV